MEIIENEKSIEIIDVFDLVKNPDQIEWQEVGKGRSRYMLYNDTEKSGASAMLLKLDAGAQSPKHLHTGYEHLLVLSGKITTTWGAGSEVSVNHKGDFIVAKPETIHIVAMDEDSIILLIFEKPSDLNV